jgi:hypothetical protein
MSETRETDGDDLSTAYMLGFQKANDAYAAELSALRARVEKVEAEATRWRDLENGIEVYVRGIRVHVPKGEPGDF